MKKKLSILLLLISISLGIVAQEDCPLPETKKLNAKERREMQEYLDALVNDWKKIVVSGHDPRLTFIDIDKKHIVVNVDYDLDDSAAANMETLQSWPRVAALFDATKHLSDIFGLLATLGYEVELSVSFRPNGKIFFFSYDNETLRRIMLLENVTSATIYNVVTETKKNIPFEFDDSVICTGTSYCNHLWVLNLHSMVEMSPDVEPYTEWMMYLSALIEQREYLYYIGMDSSTARFVIVQDGVKDTMIFEYSPAQLLGEESTIDVDHVGRYIARVINRSLPQPLPAGDGSFENCEYDPSLKVLVFNYLMSELSILNTEGQEAQVKPAMMNAMMNVPDGQEFLSTLVELGVGIELRMQSRTTRRTSTFTYTTDELRIYMLEQQ